MPKSMQALLELHCKGVDVGAELRQQLAQAENPFALGDPNTVLTLCVAYRVPEIGGIQIMYLPDPVDDAITEVFPQSIILTYDEDLEKGRGRLVEILLPKTLFTREDDESTMKGASQ